jgi:asparagine synthase (glutamine-hydrolysing)
MCGITGKIDLDGPVDAGLVERMCAVLAHRGPDSRGTHVDAGVGLGIQRLAVIDVPAGDQPIYNEDRSIVIVFNGEIYNYVELREQLRARGHTFRTGSDTETIVHLYEEHGVDCLEHLRGMFAFAIWDSRRKRLLLGRDRVGKKPLFYRATARKLWFASEPRALLLDPNVPRDVDAVALDAYLRFQYVPQPASAFAGIRKLSPAHLLVWDGGEPEIRNYWRLSRSAQEDMTLDEASDIVRASLLEATRLRLRSDVPLGAFLSGGVDSSAVVAAMAMEGSGRVRTFSIGFDVERFDETAYARQVAARYDTEHHEFRVAADAIEVLPRLVWHYGEPFADASALPSFYLSELTRRHVTVALNGDGGDENFAGYARYRAQLYAEYLGRLPRPLRRGLAASAGAVARSPRSGRLPGRIARVLTAVDEPAWQRYDRMMSYFTRADLDELYEPEFAATLPDPRPGDALIRDPWLRSDAHSPIGRILDVDVQTYLPDDLLVKMDIATMAHSLEVRSPFLDHVLMERVAQLPDRLKLRRGAPKALLKHAVRPWLPDAVVDRPKMGFGVPIANWFRGPLARLPGDVLLDSRATSRGMMRPGVVRRLIDDHQASRADNSGKLWALLQLELWLRTYVDVSEPTEQRLALVN